MQKKFGIEAVANDCACARDCQQLDACMFHVVVNFFSCFASRIQHAIPPVLISEVRYSAIEHRPETTGVSAYFEFPFSPAVGHLTCSEVKLFCPRDRFYRMLVLCAGMLCAG